MTLAYRDPTIPDSPPARWDPRWKLAAMLVFALGVAVLQRPAPLLVAFGCTLALLASARLSPRRILDRVALLLLAILPFAIAIPLFVERGLTLASLVALRCVTLGLIAFFVTNTAPLPRTFAAAGSLGVPGAIVLVAQLAYRYAFVLFGEARRLRIAMWTRAFRVRTNAHTYRSLGHVAGALLVSGGERAERVAAAMKCRGFDGTPRMLTPFHTTFADVASSLAVVAGTIALVCWERLS